MVQGVQKIRGVFGQIHALVPVAAQQLRGLIHTIGGEYTIESTVLICLVKHFQTVAEQTEGGANEKAVLRLFINCPFVCINFDFFWLNKARQLYMDF